MVLMPRKPEHGLYPQKIYLFIPLLYSTEMEFIPQKLHIFIPYYVPPNGLFPTHANFHHFIGQSPSLQPKTIARSFALGLHIFIIELLSLLIFSHKKIPPITKRSIQEICINRSLYTVI